MSFVAAQHYESLHLVRVSLYPNIAEVDLRMFSEDGDIEVFLSWYVK